MSQHEFTVPASSLDAAGRPYTFPVRAAWIRGALEGHEASAAGADGLLDVRLSKSGTDVVIHGRLKADVVLPCARCLEPVTVRIDQEVGALMVPAARVAAGPEGEYEFQPDEADTLPYDGETVVLDDLVRDELLLEIPMIPLCRDDCPGISPSPALSGPAGGEHAADRGEAPIDPRLMPLLRLKQQKKKE